PPTASWPSRSRTAVFGGSPVGALTEMGDEQQDSGHEQLEEQEVKRQRGRHGISELDQIRRNPKGKKGEQPPQRQHQRSIVVQLQPLGRRQSERVIERG